MRSGTAGRRGGLSRARRAVRHGRAECERLSLLPGDCGAARRDLRPRALLPAAEATPGTQRARDDRLARRAPPVAGDACRPDLLDVGMSQTKRTLIITGPNTGGKTVTLKTVGLLVLMAQSGLHIPQAAGSQLPISPRCLRISAMSNRSRRIYSTFSSRMTNIVRVVKEAGAHALILFDEIGAGTDPGRRGCAGKIHSVRAAATRLPHHCHHALWRTSSCLPRTPRGF